MYTDHRSYDTMQNPLEEFSFSDPFSTWWPFILALIVGIVTTIRSYICGPNCPSESLVTGKTVVLTGGSSGVGLEVAVELLNRGAVVIIGTRQPQTTQQTFSQLLTSKRIKQGSQWKIKLLDLSSLDSVRQFAHGIDEPKIDILINNAGIAFHPFEKTKDGFELHFAVNYLGHFLLTLLLLPKLKLSDEGRVINTSAQAHHNGEIDLEKISDSHNFSSGAAFARSKLALVLMARTLATSWKDTSVTINAVNPGLVRGTKHKSNTVLSKSFHFRLVAAPTAWLLMKTPQQAAQTIIYLAAAEELKGVRGRYYSNCTEVEPSETAMDYELGRKLYQKSLLFAGLHETKHKSTFFKV